MTTKHSSTLASAILSWIAALALALVLLWVWEMQATANTRVGFFFSSPSAVGSALVQVAGSGQAGTDALASAQETLVGLLYGALAGGVVGLLGLILPRTRDIALSAIAVLSALPILALAPMFLIWFGVGMGLKIALAAMLSGLVFASQVLSAGRAIPPDLSEFMAANRITGRQALAKIVLPLATPAALHRFPDAVNAAFLGVFVGEFIAADRGLGYRILRSGSLYAIDQVLAYTALAMLLLLSIQIVVAISRSTIVAVVQRQSLDRVYV